MDEMKFDDPALQGYVERIQELEYKIEKSRLDNEQKRVDSLDIAGIEHDDLVMLAIRRGRSLDEVYGEIFSDYATFAKMFDELIAIKKRRESKLKDEKFLEENLPAVLELQASKSRELGRDVLLSEIQDRVMFGEWKLDIKDSESVPNPENSVKILDDKKRQEMINYIDDLLAISDNEEEQKKLEAILEKL